MDNHNQFIAAIEAHYGLQYDSAVERATLKAFLAQKDSAGLMRLYQSTITKFSKRWNKLPDLAVFIEIEHNRDTVRVSAEKAWQLLLRVSDTVDVIITDHIAHYVVSGFGSWSRFCEARDGQYRELTHKDFIDRYALAYNSGVDSEPVKLRGSFSEAYGQIEGIQTRVIGDGKVNALADNDTPLLGAIKQLAGRKA